jgi:hypothetical protein
MKFTEQQQRNRATQLIRTRFQLRTEKGKLLELEKEREAIRAECERLDEAVRAAINEAVAVKSDDSSSIEPIAMEWAAIVVKEKKRVPEIETAIRKVEEVIATQERLEQEASDALVDAFS